MNVFGTGIHKDPWKPGIFFRGGDICHPYGKGNFFTAPFFLRRNVWRAYCKLAILPFISLHIGRFGIYFGFKLYGVDREEYVNWLLRMDVYEGSMALHLSIRTTPNWGNN